MVGLILIRIKGLDLTPGKITGLVYLIKPIGTMVLKTYSSIRGGPTYIKILRVIGGPGN